MKKTNEKTKFSYLDVFFLLILALVVTLVIAVLKSSSVETLSDKTYRVEFSCRIEQPLSEAIPAEGKTLYDQGDVIGTVDRVEQVHAENEIHVFVTATLSVPPPAVGEAFSVETDQQILTMTVDVVAEQPDSKGQTNE